MEVGGFVELEEDVKDGKVARVVVAKKTAASTQAVAEAPSGPPLQGTVKPALT